MFPRVTDEAWRTLQVGDRVKVVHPISQMERDLLGRVFIIVRFSSPHGYAVVGEEWHGYAVIAGDGWGVWHLHPEALEKV